MKGGEGYDRTKHINRWLGKANMTPQEVKLIKNRLFQIEVELAKLNDGDMKANPMKMLMELRDDLND